MLMGNLRVKILISGLSLLCCFCFLRNITRLLSVRTCVVALI